MVFSAHWPVGCVGWGGDVNVRLTCTHGGCYAIAFLLPVDTCSMLRQRWGVWGGVGWGGSVNVRLTCTHGGCYAIAFLFPWTHAPCYGSDGVCGVVWGGDVNVRLTCTHGGCYATAFLLPVDTCLHVVLAL